MSDTSEPAFPLKTMHRDGYEEVYSGMSLRDFYAGMAIVAAAHAEINFVRDEKDAEAIAKRAYILADAMLKARNGSIA